MKFKRNSNFLVLKKKLTKKRRHLLTSVRQKHSGAVSWLEKRGHKLERLAQKGAVGLVTGAAMFLVSGSAPAGISIPTLEAEVASLGKMVGQVGIGQDKSKEIVQKLSEILPKKIGSLTTQQEAQLEEFLSEQLGIKAKIELEGKKLNINYALIGGEQHLYRYPGDTLDKHFINMGDKHMFGGAGVAPGLGAWGYFVSSGASLTQEDILRERYYVAVQTFLTEAWKKDFKEAAAWFKYRKVLVMNPKTGHGVVAVIGDAGPATFTGKSFGGSPEVMHEVDLATGPRKGEVVILFIDDPNNEVPLGPVKYKADFKE